LATRSAQGQAVSTAPHGEPPSSEGPGSSVGDRPSEAEADGEEYDDGAEELPPEEQRRAYVEAQKAAFEKALQAAKAGGAKEQFELSHFYRFGQGVEPDEKEADYWLQKSAAKGIPEAEIELGETLAARNDYDGAFQWLLKAAQSGDVTAQSLVAGFYYEGKGVALDYAQAMEWFVKAAAQQNSMAMVNVGYMYQHGMGVAADFEIAMKWYRRASDAGNMTAKFDIGTLFMKGEGVPKDLHEAERWFKQCEGLPEANLGLALIYLEGPPELKDSGKALPYLKKAVEQGQPIAGAVLAKLYLTNELPELKKDPSLAIQLLRPAAEKGEALPQFLMGYAEEQNKNYGVAASWFGKAAEQDFARAVLALAGLYSQGRGVDRDFGKAAKLYVRANDLAQESVIANNAGWFFAACEDPKYRNRELALKYGLRGVELSEGKNSHCLDTLAEAYFANEQYGNAVSTEVRALELEPQNESYKKSLTRFQAALGASKEKR
jgi:hypothetical protein